MDLKTNGTDRKLINGHLHSIDSWTEEMIEAMEQHIVSGVSIVEHKAMMNRIMSLRVSARSIRALVNQGIEPDETVQEYIESFPQAQVTVVERRPEHENRI